jgi:hypothetical protein
VQLHEDLTLLRDERRDERRGDRKREERWEREGGEEKNVLTYIIIIYSKHLLEERLFDSFLN